MPSKFPSKRKRPERKGKRPRSGDRGKAGRSRRRSESPPELTDEGILIVDDAGKLAPVEKQPGQGWRVPQSGKTLPLNQRFAQMWHVPAMLLERLALENALRRALDRGELAVHLQPQADVRTGRIVGTEALMRWQHPDRGLLWPEDFIPLAEETGVIVGLGEWGLRTACAYVHFLQEERLPHIRVAVNLSPRQFQQPNLVRLVGQVLSQAQVDPASLELEITETTAMQNPDVTVPVLAGLRDIGVRIALDDFGVGYSSLAYLNELPVDSIKIDRSLIQGVTRERDHTAIAAAIITLARDLGLYVIAEGVETQDQLDFLSEQRCDAYQGFLLAEPMPLEELDAMVAQHEPSQGRHEESSGPDVPDLGSSRLASG